MSAGTKISWTDRTWNPTVGCTRVSDGCDHCYAIGMVHRFAGRVPSYAGTTTNTGERVDWTGQVSLVEQRLAEPATWPGTSLVFVDSTSDLFHDGVPVEYIARVWAAMATAPQHTFQVLTKRHARLRSVLSSPEFRDQVADAVRVTGEVYSRELVGWPLPNVWVGVSVESRQWADIRIPALLDTPAAVRWISAEPLLGPLDLGPWLGGSACPADPDGLHYPSCGCDAERAGLDWVVTGGESGPGARPVHPDWIRSVRDQCAGTGVAFHHKQWGAWGPVDRVQDWVAGGRWILPDGSFVDGPAGALQFDQRRAEGLQLVQLRSVKKNGRTLDGVVHDAYPKDGMR